MDDLASKLADFSDAIRDLPETSQQPKTAFELLNSTHLEGAWQAYLGYFLDPTETHGLESQFLAQFLNLLESQTALSFSPSSISIHSTSDVEVELERQSELNNRPDIIVTSGKEWFLCIELKLHSPEGGGEKPQTIRYAKDDGIVPGGVDSFDDGSYIYIKPQSEPNSESEQFNDINWECIQTAVNQTIANKSGTSYTRTLAQLSDFSALIKSNLTMIENDNTIQQRKELYFQYSEEIEEAHRGFEQFVESVLQREWVDALRKEFSPNNMSQYQWEYYAPHEDGRSATDFGQVRVPRWTTAKVGDEKLDIHWEHRPEKSDFKKGQLRLILELEEPNRSKMDKTSPERYHQFREDLLKGLEDALDEATNARWVEWNSQPSSSDKKLIRFDYKYQPGDEEGYYQALQFALEDTEPITEFVTETLNSTDYTNYSLD